MTQKVGVYVCKKYHFNPFILGEFLCDAAANFWSNFDEI